VSPDRSIDAQRIADAVDHSEIRRLQDAYADIVTRRRWNELGEVFLDSTILELDLRGTTKRFVGREAIGGFIDEALRQFEFFQFGILGTRIRLCAGGDTDAAAGRMYMTERRQTADGHWSQIYGVYHDRFTRRDGRWWFAHRIYHSLARRDLPAVVFEFPHHLDLDALP